MKIKRFFLPLMLCLTGCSNFNYEVKPVDENVHYDNVYVIMGQSNASGVSQYSFLQEKAPETYAKYSVENPDVQIITDVDGLYDTVYHPMKFGYGYNTDCFGPEIGISDVIASPGETSYIIKATFSGSCLQTQYMNMKGQKLELYNRFIPFILNSLKTLKDNGKNPRVKGVFWMQGESDSMSDIAKTYANAESLFVKNLRKDLNEYVYGYMNFVDAYISTWSSWKNPFLINNCKEKVKKEDEHNYCIKTNDEDRNSIGLHLKSDSGDGYAEDSTDNAHYNSLSMLVLGRAAGLYLIK